MTLGVCFSYLSGTLQLAIAYWLAKGRAAWPRSEILGWLETFTGTVLAHLADWCKKSSCNLMAKIRNEIRYALRMLHIALWLWTLPKQFEQKLLPLFSQQSPNSNCLFAMFAQVKFWVCTILQPQDKPKLKIWNSYCFPKQQDRDNVLPLYSFEWLLVSYIQYNYVILKCWSSDVKVFLFSITHTSYWCFLLLCISSSGTPTAPHYSSTFFYSYNSFTWHRFNECTIQQGNLPSLSSGKKLEQGTYVTTFSCINVALSNHPIESHTRAKSLSQSIPERQFYNSHRESH